MVTIKSPRILCLGMSYEIGNSYVEVHHCLFPLPPACSAQPVCFNRTKAKCKRWTSRLRFNRLFVTMWLQLTGWVLMACRHFSYSLAFASSKENQFRQQNRTLCLHQKDCNQVFAPGSFQKQWMIMIIKSQQTQERQKTYTCSRIILVRPCLYS